METGERLASPSSATSCAPSTPTVSAASKGNISTGATTPNSTLSTCGHLFRTSGDQPFNLSTVSSAFPMVNHPAFGLYTTSSGRSEFGGLGTLGASTALAAHSQLGPFPEWWRSEAHARTGAAFFPPILGIPPLFAASIQNHDSTSFQSLTANKNGRGATKGMNGAINGSNITSPSGLSSPAAATAVLSSSGHTKAVNSNGRGKKCNQEQNSQLQDNSAEKTKDKVLIQTINEAKKDGKVADSKEAQDKKTNSQLQFVGDLQSKPAFHSQQKAHQGISQHLPLVFQSSQAKEEAVKKHLSVIHSTGIATSAKPLALVTQPRRDSSTKMLTPSPEIPKAGSKNIMEEAGSQANDIHLKQGIQWALLKEEEIVPCIRAMEGRRGRPPNPERQRSTDGSRMRRRKGRPPNVGAFEFPSATDAKLIRKLEAQEIARQAAQIKLMRKLEKQALARAAKEARKQQERKLELRRLELEIAKELKKPNEDMCLSDHKPLPELPRIPGLVLSGSTFSDCLMVVQFLRNFGKVLGFDITVEVPSLSVLQEGLLNVGESMGEVQDLLVRLLSAVVCDPGLPPGHRAKTAFGDHLTNIGINRDNVSEILQIYMEAHCGQTELTESLKTKAFQAHTPSQKASVLAFLVNELACSKCVVSEIDKNIDHMSNLRRDKWVVEGKLRKLRIIHAKKTGKRDTSIGTEGSEEQQSLGTSTPGRKRKRKGGDSDDDDDDDDDSDEPGDEEEDEEDDKKGKKVETCDDEDDGDQAVTVEELEKQIDKLMKQQSQFRRKLFEASHSLRSMMFGQDRYKRRYWVLPQCGGIFVEGMESGEGPEELAKERERLKNDAEIQIKEEPPELSEEKPHNLELGINISSVEDVKEKDNPNLFLQKPGSFSKLSKLLEVARMSPESDIVPQKQNGSHASIPTTVPSPSHTNSQHALSSSQSGVLQACPDSKLDSSSNFFSPLNSPGKLFNSPLLPNDQLLRVLTEKTGQWFSILPRTPCDNSSVTSATLPTASSPQPSSTGPKSPSPLPAPLVSGPLQSPVGLNPFALSALQNVPFTSSPVPSSLSSGFGVSEANGNPFLAPSVSTSKSESPVPQNDKFLSAPSPALEVAKPVDYHSPRPIPEEMQTGWWRITDSEELKALVKGLHFRGIREKALQKQIQKHMDYICQACAKNKDVPIIEINDNEENLVTQETLDSWCVEEQAMEMDIAILQQVEELERRVASASLQVKGWIYPEPHSEREDLVYFEHKPFTHLRKEEQVGGQEDDCSDGTIVRRINNPLDIAVTRLAELERNIERRYLKSPLSTTIQIKLDNVGTVTVPAPAPSSSGDGDGGEEDIAPGLKVWRKALSEARSAAQVALCIQQLQKSIAWEKSIMKVASGQSPKNKKLQNRSGKKNSEAKKSKSKSGTGDVSEDDSASTSSTPKKRVKDPKKRKGDEVTSSSQTKQDGSSCQKKSKPAKDNSKDLALCRYLNLEAFMVDVRLVFDNCEIFNEDDSDIGRAGHNMRRFFERRWSELFKTS
ncbi:BAZ2B protein, partial [Polypterus senegalus]